MSKSMHSKCYYTLITCLAFGKLASSFDLFSLLSDIAFPSVNDDFRYRGWSGSLTGDLHPAFKTMYRFANSKHSPQQEGNATISPQREGNETGRVYAFDVNVRPQWLVPAGSLLSNKWSLFVPVRNSSRFRNSFNFDLYGYVPFVNWIPFLKARKRRSISPQKKGPEDKDQLLRRTRREKRELFNRFEETLTNFNIPGRDCLLRTVCEIAEAPFMEGIFGEFLNSLFRARTQIDADDDVSRQFHNDEYDEFVTAELRGQMKGNCGEFYPRCSRSLFDLLPQIRNNIISRR